LSEVDFVRKNPVRKLNSFKVNAQPESHEQVILKIFFPDFLVTDQGNLIFSLFEAVLKDKF
jgi:hypothetical protein